MKSCSLMCLILGGLGARARRRRTTRIPSAISTPPAIWSTTSGSERRMTASTAATNGCRFAASVALFAPIRWIERNQRTFVSTSGPSVAKTSSTQISQPRSQSCSEVCGEPGERDRDPRCRDDDRAHRATASTSASAAPTTTEYAAQVAAVERPSRIPASCSETSPPEPAATSPTPTNETSAASQKRPVGRSRAEREPEERREDRDRAEDEADRRRRRDVEREDERELVQPEGARSESEERQMPALDAKRPLARRA